MQMVKVKFEDAHQEAAAVVELARRTRVYCLPDDVYAIPAGSLAVLDGLRVRYEVLSREGFDAVVKTLRDSVAAKV